jgi:hypothetical protein
MKQTVLAVAILATLGLGACSSTKVASVGPGVAVPAGTQQAISEQRLENDFKRQGVKVIYSLTGELQAIEVSGYAAVWGNSQNAAREAYRVAELEAKKSLNDFINKEVISTTTSVKMISKNLEKARDNKTNNFSTNRGRDTVAGIAVDEDVDNDAQNKGEVNREENTAVRNDALTIASRVQTTIRIRNQGILGGLYLVEGTVINDGKNVRVVYRWDQKHTGDRINIRNQMAM